MNICLPLPYFQSEGLEDSYRQYHESSADESDADGFFVTFVHTADKSTKYFRQKNKRNKKYPRFISIRHKLISIRHKLVQNIPDIWNFPSTALPLPSEILIQMTKNMNTNMKPRTIIGILFVVASLLKLATLWGILHWSWFERTSEGPWAMYLSIFVLLYVGVHLIIESYRRDPDQWLHRPLPIGEDGKRICCSAHYGGDEYIYHGEVFHGARLDAFCGVVVKSRSFIGGVNNSTERLTDKDVPCLHIVANNFLGGVDIKN